MKIKLSDVLKYIFLCSFDDNNIEIFNLSDIIDCVYSTRFMMNTFANFSFEVENDCYRNKDLCGPIKNCAQEMVPGVFMLDKKQLIKVSIPDLISMKKSSRDEAKFFKICSSMITARADRITERAEQEVIKYTKETNKVTNDENIKIFSKWVKDNAEAVKNSAEVFFEKKNNCVLCGKYILRIPDLSIYKDDSNKNNTEKSI